MELTEQELNLLKQELEKCPGAKLYLHRNRTTGVLTVSPFQTPLSVCFIDEQQIEEELKNLRNLTD